MAREKTKYNMVLKKIKTDKIGHERCQDCDLLFYSSCCLNDKLEEILGQCDPNFQNGFVFKIEEKG